MQPDQDQNAPASAPDNQSTDPQGLDSGAASDQPGTPGPQQTPAATAAQFPFPGDQKAPAATQPQQSQSLVPAAASATPAAPKVDPAVEKASKVHSILQALSGGPHYATSIDANTGTVKETQVPMSNGQYARSLAAAVLTGAFSGLGEKGPGAEGKAAEAGFNAAVKQQQDQKQQEQLQASQTYARQAAIAQTNFQMHQTATRMGQLDYEQHKQFVGDNAQAIENIKAVGGDLATGVREQDLLPKYHVTAANAVPDGVVKRLNEDGSQATDKYGQPLWDNTYTVLDPNKKIQLDQDTANFLAQHHVPGTFNVENGKVVPKNFEGSPAVRAGIVVSMLSQASAIRTTEAQLNQQLSRISPDADNKFEANLRDGLDKGTVSTKALSTFAKYASMPFDEALDQMRKDKVDPSTIGQISQLVPQDAQAAMKKTRLDQEAADKSKRDAAAAVEKQKAELPGQIAEAAAKAKIETAAAGPRAFASEQGRIKAKAAYDASSAAVKDMVKNPKLNAIPELDQAPVNGVNVNYLKALNDADPNIAAVVKAIGEGRQLQSKYGLVKEDGQRLASIVQRAYPEYSTLKADAYEKLLNSFTSGEDKKQIESGNTTYRHIQDYVENSNKFLANAPGAPTRKSLAADASQLVEEVNSAYTKGVLHEGQRENLIDGLTSVNPVYRDAKAKELTKLLSAKTSEKLGTFRRGAVTSATPDFEVVSPEANDAYHFIMGNEADPNFGTSRTNRAGQSGQNGSNTSQAATQPYAPPAGSFAGRATPGGPIIQWKLPDGSVVDAKTGQKVQ